MKDLKTYIIEAIKPPRLSAKNRDLWAPKPLDEEEAMKWLEENCKVEGKVKIVDGKINVEEDIYITNKNIERIPYPFGEVTGFFDCSYCKKLKSLNNSPQRVGDDFDCSNCKNLTSLAGAPEEVGGDFYCYKCANLKSLEGAPKEVGNNFICHDCGKEFTEENVKKVCKVGRNIRISRLI